LRLQRSSRASVASVVLLGGLACARQVPAPTLAPPEGRTSFRALVPAGADKATVEAASETITPAYASPDNQPPEYPAYALEAGCRSGTVPVRVFVGADGNVTGQKDIPGRPLPGDNCHVAFRAAVQGTVNGWKFAPAYRVASVPRPTRDGEPGITRWDQSPIPVYLDFEFFFEVVAGKGVVRSR
jgi:hypothetical protein